MDKERLLNFINKQIFIEKDIVSSLKEAIERIKNAPVKEVLSGISLDSEKHAEMYDAILRLLTTTPQALSQDQLDKQINLVEKHIKIESELIKKIDEMLPLIDNVKIQLLLNAILSDEKKHHELLTKVLEILIRGETITENEWFNFIWDSVPFHGSPGG